jgi:hypothetical protein
MWRWSLDGSRTRSESLLGDKSVVVGTLQFVRRYSFSLPRRKVVFNRIHAVGFLANRRALC